MSSSTNLPLPLSHPPSSTFLTFFIPDPVLTSCSPLPLLFLLSSFSQSVADGTVSNSTAASILPPGATSSNLANILLSLANSSLADTLSFNVTLNNVTQKVNVVLTSVSTTNLNTTSLNNASLAVLTQLVQAINNGTFTLAVPPSPPPPSPSPPLPLVAGGQSPSSSSSSSETTKIAIGVGVAGGVVVVIVAALAIFAIKKRKSSPSPDSKAAPDSIDKAEAGQSWKTTAEQPNGSGAASPQGQGWNASLANDEPEIGAPINVAAASAAGAKAARVSKEPSSSALPPPPLSAQNSQARFANDVLPSHLAAEMTIAEKNISAGGANNRPSSGGRNRVSPEPIVNSNSPSNTNTTRLSPRNTGNTGALAASAAMTAGAVITADAYLGPAPPSPPPPPPDAAAEGDHKAFAPAAEEEDGQHFMLPGGFVSFKTRGNSAGGAAADRAVGSHIFSAEQRGTQPDAVIEEQEQEQEAGTPEGEVSTRRPFGAKLPTIENAPRYQAGHLPPMKKP